MSSESPETPEVSAGPSPHEQGKDERMWATICHLAAFAGLAIPLGNIAGPLIVWLIKREGLPLVEDQGKEALNFQISVTIYILVSIALCFACIGFVLLPVAVIFAIVMTIVAAVKASTGVAYRYPLTIRFLK
jgi:uncharacterized Tic20 family protein